MSDIDRLLARRHALLNGKDDLGITTQSMITTSFAASGVLVKEASALQGMTMVNCVMIHIPWGAHGTSDAQLGAELRALRADMNLPIVLWCESPPDEAKAAAANIGGALQMVCLSGPEAMASCWASLQSELLSSPPAFVVVSETGPSQIADAISTLQNIDYVVLYIGFADSEQFPLAAAAVGVAAGEASNSLKSVASIICVNESLKAVEQAIKVCREATCPPCKCVVQ
eukprot:TRINITY_DN73614_c0_g1_i1.p1 TRINITY_DN73614_c0_g1~~TRINITY_DN73614_c0_g1_i1.p1  ORF type:complete len:228 (-),score=23.25 TRINITY_DN73614_c0_g1_i1:127-810(-)